MIFFRDREQRPFEWIRRKSKLGRWVRTVQLMGMYREGTLWLRCKVAEVRFAGLVLGWFYESPEDVHTVSRNASQTKAAKLFVFFIKTEGAPILTPVH
jgi:hypothetical protein